MLTPRQVNQFETVMEKGKVSTQELSPFLGSSILTRSFSVFSKFGSFSDVVWKIYKSLYGVQWDKVGRFEGRVNLEVRGGTDYYYRTDKSDPFRFIRSTGEEIIPQDVVTDGGSIPRLAWAIPGFDPWTYLPAYLIHDWDFVAHHCIPEYKRTFSESNATLAEAIYTMMMAGTVEEDWRRIVLIHSGCSSYVGRRVWDRVWSQADCACALPLRSEE